MMAEIKQFPGGIVSREQQAEVYELEAAILAAIEKAKAVGVPQGFIVSLLHAHAFQQTSAMFAGD